MHDDENTTAATTRTRDRRPYLTGAAAITATAIIVTAFTMEPGAVESRKDNPATPTRALAAASHTPTGHPTPRRTPTTAPATATAPTTSGRAAAAPPARYTQPHPTGRNRPGGHQDLSPLPMPTGHHHRNDHHSLPDLLPRFLTPRSATAKTRTPQPRHQPDQPVRPTPEQRGPRRAESHAGTGQTVPCSRIPMTGWRYPHCGPIWGTGGRGNLLSDVMKFIEHEQPTS
ncbi:hypothetical protein [Planomonospora venezuelensis]|uniref:Uncharacterized protein n=1 Tax=Planomonospora venezuelensis TaxID=1999 RepID=A0A841DGM2_PLAVE|nr:hypothetical protein [Planomonospora venezuelensis]MBB5967245.1 hypothetical protein [Planomonospora venezuelensis]GIN03014.1 hypothetical protein Pve01_46720 [Planomonospora venezuelensis]